MQSVIKNCCDNKFVSSIYTDQIYHLTGFILVSTDEYVVISHINAHGLYDGYILKRTEDIYRIDYDGKYEKKIEALYLLKNQTHDLITEDDLKDEKSPLELILDIAKSTHKIISIEYEDVVISGFVDSFTEELVTLFIVDEYGYQDGHTTICLSSIETIALDTDTEQDILLLYDHLKEIQDHANEN